MKRQLLLLFVLSLFVCLAQAQKAEIYSRWSGRMVICNNDQSIYTAYQWYKSSSFSGPYSIIPNATKQYYAEENGLNGYYFVKATINTSGQIVNSDTLAIHTQPEKASVFPNPVSKSSAFRVETTSPDIPMASVQIFTASGVKVREYNTTDASTEIYAPTTTGCYIIRIRLSNGETITEKLFVK